MSDVLTSQDINEMADAQPGVVQPIVTLSRADAQKEPSDKKSTAIPVATKGLRISTARIGNDGNVTFDPREDSRTSA
jgi:hypothetical protein